MPTLTPYQKAALDFNKHISLTANAGSGKTFVLSKRFVEIALRKEVKLSRIVAITFTEKAASELNKKIANEIEERLKNETNEPSRRKLEQMRRQLISANISTIHSFCINLLREFSAEAGIDANFTPLSKQDSDDLIDLSIEDRINHALKGDECGQEVRSLIRLLGSKNLLASELKKMIERRKSLQTLIETLYNKPVEDIGKFYIDKSKELIDKLASGLIGSLISKVELLNGIILESDPGNSKALEVLPIVEKLKLTTLPDSLSVLPELRERILTSSGTVAIRGYLSKLNDRPDSDIETIQILFKEILPFENLTFEKGTSLLLAETGKKIMKVFQYVLENYESRKRSGGYLDFEDILLFTRQLTANEYVRRALRENYEYIMIDEYQDTNEIQYDIVMPILDNLNEGNLFVVGDEKQSIYMFRDAELEIFKKTKEQISGSDNSGVLLLPHSFRVAPQIAHFTNELFRKLFDEPNPLFNEVGYNELLCSRDPDDEGSVEFIININRDDNESDLLARRVLKLVSEEGLSFEDVAVLCRKRSAFDELEKSFARYDIPYLIGGGTGFFQRQIIYDIYNYISFLVNHDDDTSFVGILRSPFYTIPDDEIYRISKIAGDSFWEKFCNFCKNENVYEEERKLLNKHIKLAASNSISKVLRTILYDGLYWPAVSALSNSKQELSNLYKLIGLAREFNEQSFKTLYDFKIYLKEAINYLEDEGQAQITESANALRIMTLHQSKGLEFKAVFLFKCNDKIREERAKSKSLVIDKNWGLLTKVPRNEDYFSDYSTPPIVEVYNYIQSKKLYAEAKRLFYVGVTRAIDRLFITGDISKGNPNSNTFLKFIGDAFNTQFDSERVELVSKLKFMLSEEFDFQITEKEMITSIPVLTEIEESGSLDFTKEPEKFEKYFVEEIDDAEKNEIISATKIAIFTQCPTKYYLTYELGYSRLFKLIKSHRMNYEFRYEEDEDTKLYSDLRGRLIHKVLEKETERGKLKEYLLKFLREENESNQLNKNEVDELINSMYNELSNFYDSQIFKEIHSYKKFYNEYELYARETDFYLYGIIDKLILSHNGAIIVDYKTDSVDEKQLDEKKNHYLPQLKFYSYLIAKSNRDIEKISAKLIFIKRPDIDLTFSFNKEELKKFGEEIRLIVNRIRNQDFDKNHNHCPGCHYSFQNNCINDI